MTTESGTPAVLDAAGSRMVAIAASFTAEPVAEVLDYWLDRLGLPAQVEFCSYNQVLASLLDPRGLFHTNRNGLNVILYRWEDLERDARVDGGPHLEAHAAELAAAVSRAAEAGSAPMLIVMSPASPKAAIHDARFNAADAILIRDLAGIGTVRVVPSAELRDLYPVKNYYDAGADRIGRIPYQPEMFAAIATVIARHLHALSRSPMKVIVLDCDDTLWAGRCGEAGPSGIEIDAPSRALQLFAKSQRDHGMLLCICSKNNPEDVAATFAANPEMPLAAGDFVASRVNWEPKSQNILSLAKELQLGTDSFLFVDDNPIETAEVRARCPGVITVTLPDQRSDIPRFLNHIWAFDHAGLTAEDRQRTAMYQANSRRTRLQSQSVSYAEFLKNLQLEVRIEDLKREDVPRAAQMTLRTNQFNFTTQRYSESALRQIQESGEMRVLIAAVSDRFGDYGQVGLVMYTLSAQELVVNSFLLSCRALGKGVEHRMLARLGEIAKGLSLASVQMRFIPSEKNAPARNFLSGLDGASKQDHAGAMIYQLRAELAADLEFHPPDFPDESQAPARETELPRRATAETAGSAIDFEWIGRHAGDAAFILHTARAAGESRGAAAGQCADPPRTELERDLKRIWEQALQRASIGIRDNFFDLGGDSLLAVQVVVQIERLTGKELPLAALIEAPTIAALAGILQNREWMPRWRCLVPIKASGNRPPFFCVHGVGGNILEFMDMVPHIHPDQPLYGVQAIGLDGRGPRLNLTVEQMATEYIREISDLQPNGPYYIGGSSFGGLVAYEMARQLHGSGEQVGILALFDTYGPGYPRYLPATNRWKRRINRTRYRASLHWSNFLAAEPSKRIEYLRTKAGRLGQRLRQRATSMLKRLRRSVERRLFPARIGQVAAAGRWAAADYRPGKYPGTVTLFRATEQPPDIYPDRTLGWSAVVEGEIEVYDTPGHHGAIVREPRAGVLARQLIDALEKAFQHQTGSSDQRPPRPSRERTLTIM